MERKKGKELFLFGLVIFMSPLVSLRLMMLLFKKGDFLSFVWFLLLSVVQIASGLMIMRRAIALSKKDNKKHDL